MIDCTNEPLPICIATGWVDGSLAGLGIAASGLVTYSVHKILCTLYTRFPRPGHYRRAIFPSFGFTKPPFKRLTLMIGKGATPPPMRRQLSDSAAAASASNANPPALKPPTPSAAAAPTSTAASAFLPSKLLDFSSLGVTGKQFNSKQII